MIQLSLHVPLIPDISQSLKTFSKFGFGYPHVTNEYKIVDIVRFVGNLRPQMVKIFSLTLRFLRDVNFDIIRYFQISDHCNCVSMMEFSSILGHL